MDKVLLKSKIKLIRWLKSDWNIILQHVQVHELITTTEYDHLKSITVPTDVVIKLLDIIHGKGENVCRDFLNLLKNDDVNECSPELREWIKTVDTSGMFCIEHILRISLKKPVHKVGAYFS
ncbi:hypothetical protein PO909_033082 [Leuciscus waleckii]